ncbi:MAG TPA: PQQ-binding-like beta-propeller repeat protein [Vicinamibacterales bacterium]|nr:PQQ-binding-like beta-propeller repeat protein [Vicinamibacterales bacterium]
MTRFVGVAVVLAVAVADVIHAQGRGGQNWNTISADAQRTGWLRTETRISADALQSPAAGGFQLLWKVKPENQPRQLNTLTQPLILGNLISHKGFKSLAFFGGSGDVVYAYDYDLGKVYWSQKLSTAAASQPATLTCPGGLTSITRSTPLMQSAAPAGPGALGRGGAGAPPGPPAGRGPAPPTGVNPANLPITGAVWAISSGGMVHALNPHIGADLRTPVRIVPAGAKVISSVLVDNVLYAATSDACGGAQNGVYALDVSGEGTAAKARTWESGGATIAGSAAPTLGLNDTLYVATGSGGGRFANAVVAIDSKTMQALDWFTLDTPFVTSPVAFRDAGRDFVAAAAKDGRLYVLDGRTPGGADHRTPLARSALYSSGGADTGGAVTTWQDRDGVRWLLVASAGAVAADAKFAGANGAITNGFVAAFKFSGENGSFRLEPAWTSRDLTTPAPPIVLNDVVFALSSGAFRGGDSQMTGAQRMERSAPAVLYALDAKTGRELWSSGRTIAASVQNVGPSGQDGQVYVVAADGTLYAFGIPLEH